MRSSKPPVDSRRKVYLALSSSIESQLREAFLERFDAGDETQASLAKKLGVDRSSVNRRLRGEANMTIKTLADMVWALEHCVDVRIFDPRHEDSNGNMVIPEMDFPTGAVTTTRLKTNRVSVADLGPSTDTTIKISARSKGVFSDMVSAH